MSRRYAGPTQRTRDRFYGWEDYARRDSRTVSGYLFEEGEPEFDDYTVDAAQYTTQAFHDREVEWLWTKTWQMACRTHEIPNVGDYLEYEIAGYSVIVVRAAPDSIEALYNVSAPGTALIAGSGNAACFACPFHGWTYGLDGSLKVIPASWDFDHVDRASYGLRRCRAEVFDGWVFINLDTNAAPLRDFLGERIVRHLLARPDEPMWKAWHFGAIVSCNWKVFLEAFMESYHAFVHPQLSVYGADLQTRYDSFGLHARAIFLTGVGYVMGGAQSSEQEILDEALGFTDGLRNNAPRDTGPATNTIEVPPGSSARVVMAEFVRRHWGEQGLDLSEVSDSELLDGVVYFLFPNFATFNSPTGHHAWRFRPNANDPNSCTFELMSLLPVPPGQSRPPDSPLHMMAPGESFRDYAEQISGVMATVYDQDMFNCARVQKGLHSAEKITFAQFQERNIVAFHRNLEALLKMQPAE